VPRGTQRGDLWWVQARFYGVGDGSVRSDGFKVSAGQLGTQPPSL
jgi:hypothetical protein